jgi:group I intron endonuclease
MKTGIYCWTNIVNGKKYVGQSVNIDCRKREYLNNHFPNEHFKNAWNKYDKESFKHEILIECDEKDLDKYESTYMNLFKTRDRKFGYNKKEAGSHGRFHEETKKKMSIAHLGKKTWNTGTKGIMKSTSASFTSETSTGKNNKFYGKKHSIETIEHLKKAHQKYIFTIKNRITGEIHSGSLSDLASKLNFPSENISRRGKTRYYILVSKELL